MQAPPHRNPRRQSARSTMPSGALATRGAAPTMPDVRNAPPEQETAMRKKDRGLPPPFAEATKDMRFAGTFEVFVPVPDRVKPHRVRLDSVPTEVIAIEDSPPEAKRALL